METDDAGLGPEVQSTGPYSSSKAKSKGTPTMMKILKSAVAAGVIALAGTAVVAVPAQAGVTAPRYGDHVSYWNCVGPTKNPGNYYDPNWYYYCDWDWDWYAEWFWGKVDRKRVLTQAWYTA